MLETEGDNPPKPTQLPDKEAKLDAVPKFVMLAKPRGKIFHTERNTFSHSNESPFYNFSYKREGGASWTRSIHKSIGCSASRQNSAVSVDLTVHTFATISTIFQITLITVNKQHCALHLHVVCRLTSDVHR